MGIWARKRAGDTCAAGQAAPLSKASPSKGGLGGTPWRGGGDRAGDVAIAGTHWAQARRWGGGAGLALGLSGEAVHLLVPSQPEGMGLGKTIFGEKP